MNNIFNSYKDFLSYFFSNHKEGLPEIVSDFFDIQTVDFTEITNLWDLIKRIQDGYVAKRAKNQILGVVEEGAILKGNNIYIDEGSVVESGAMIIGPAIIGKNVEIRHGSYIRGNVIICDNCVIGHASEVIRSVLLYGAKAPHFNYVGDSILGKYVNLGAGTKLSNLKNDGSEIKVHVNNSSFKTGLRKFGAILGDNCMLGCNTVTNPGTLLGKNCRAYPNSTITGFVQHNTIIKLKQNLQFTSFQENN